MLVLVALLPQGWARAAEPEMLTNGEMEGPFRTGLAQGWGHTAAEDNTDPAWVIVAMNQTR